MSSPPCSSRIGGGGSTATGSSSTAAAGALAERAAGGPITNPALLAEAQTKIVGAELLEMAAAIKAYVDENANDKLDIGVLGPVEPFAFGNDARGFLGPPAFNDAAIEINGATYHTVKLSN